MRIIYLSGPITNTQNYETHFANAETQLINAGFLALNPVTLNHTDTDWHQCMRKDIKALMDCDAVAFLNGWECSRGANIERQLALSLDIPVKPLSEWIHTNGHI